MATPVNTPDKVTYFAETDYRSKRIKFGIRDEDRERHTYVIGKTGMGKSTLLENLAIQDIQNGEGICFIDPHGGTAETLLSYIPEHRINDVIYFAPFDQEYPVALNVMEDIGRDKRPLVASGLIGAFKKVWVDAWSARMEYILSNALLALLEFPGATLLGVNRVFADKNYRSLIVNNVTDPSVKAFWLDEYAKYSDKFATEATAAIQNKVGQFAANPLIRNMVGQSKSTFDIRKVMDERKILIVNLSKGRMGEGNANLVGSMLITKIYLAAMSRADVGPEVVRKLPPFYLYVDEFQSFANESFADILSEARKYKLSLTIAHQYIEQMSDEVRAAVFGNVGSMVAFRVGAYDAEVLEKEFAPAFTAEDMVNLGARQIYLKLMINGVGSSPFSATTLNRPKFPPQVYTNEVIAMSRKQFGRPRALVEEEIKKWHEPVSEPPRDPNAPLVPETRKYALGTRPLRVPVGASAAYTGVLPRPYAPRDDSPQQLSPRPPQSEVFRQMTLDADEDTSARRIERPTEERIAVPTKPNVMRSEIEQPQLRALNMEQPRIESRLQAPISEPELKTGRGELHQPFRDEIKKLQSVGVVEGVRQAQKVSEPVLPPKPLVLNRQPEQARDVTHRESHVRENSEQRPNSLPRVATLSHLKMQKKDKGPSTQNLSSLKQLIDAAFAGGRDGEGHETPKVASMGGHTVPEERMKEGVSPAKRSSPSSESVGMPGQNLQRGERQITAPSLLGDTTFLPPSKEVPEDVLRGLLAE